LTGVTPFLLASRQFLNQGHHEGVYAASVRFKGTIKDLFSATKHSTSSAVLIHSAVEEEPGTMQCHLSAHANSQRQCEEALSQIGDR